MSTDSGDAASGKKPPMSNKKQSVDSLVRDSEKRSGAYERTKPARRDEIPSQDKAPRGPKTGV